MMKPLIAVTIVLCLAVCTCALAEERTFSPFDYRILHTADGKYVTYEFPDVMLYLPIEWEGEITVESTDTGVAFFQKASYDKFLEDGLPKGGFLFKLRVCTDESFRDRPKYEYIGFSENVHLHFYLSRPSDYEAYVYDDVIRSEFDEMSRKISQIALMARITPSVHFYTDGIESADPGMS